MSPVSKRRGSRYHPRNGRQDESGDIYWWGLRDHGPHHPGRSAAARCDDSWFAGAVTSETPATGPEQREPVFGRGSLLFLGLVAGAFVIAALAIPMMIIASVATPPPDAPPPAAATPEEAGEEVATEIGCFACHTSDGADLVGPTWAGVAGSERELELGETVVADDDYLYNSIVDPRSQIVSGFDPLMPEGYGDQLSDEEISQIIAYIKTLSG